MNSQRRYPNEALIRFLASLPKGGRVLEIGCGSGANLWMISKEGFDAYGLDSAPTGLELCKRMLDSWNTAAKLFLGEMQHLPFEQETFDAIVDIVSMQHVNLTDHAACYDESYRCLKTGGLFFQYHVGSDSTPFLSGGGTRIDDCTMDNVPNDTVPLNNNGIMCFLDKTRAERMLETAGFKDIKIETVKRTYRDDAFVEYLAIRAVK